MNKTALFVRHKALPGHREELQQIWERYVKPRAEANPGHEAYFFCLDEADPDVVCVFQLYSSEAALEAFLQGDWYPGYLAEVSQVVAAPPELTRAAPAWIKAGS